MSKVAKAAVLKADSREGHGKGAARALRREGKVPAIIYNKESAPVSISLSLRDVTVEYGRGRFHSRLIDIEMGKETIHVLPKDMQFHPVTDVIEHVDFLRVEKGTKIRVNVPIVIHGKDKCVGIKRGGALNVVRREIEFWCLPESIPTHIDIDVKDLNIGDSLHINSVALPNDVKPVIERNFTIATIAGRLKQDDAAPGAPTDNVDVPATAQSAPAEGDKKEDEKK